MKKNNILKNFDEVYQRIEKIRLKTDDKRIVKIVAVSKNVTSSEILSLYELGQRAFGENRVQDLSQKNDILKELPMEWHFIGRLQKNKINHLIDIEPFLLHSLDSYELAVELDSRLDVKSKKLDALLQINSACEESKAGVLPQLAIEEYLKIKENCPNINLKGVMTIGAHSDELKIVEKSFETAYKIYESLQNNDAVICSMGMSNDFELAIECGSNMLRLGSVLFA